MPRSASQIPAFSLYGEPPDRVDLRLHIETIAARSRRYAWRIGSHLHRGLHQMLWVSEGPVEASLGAESAAGDGPLAIVIPPGVAHSFAFSPRTKGYILTFDPRALLEGEGDAGPTLTDLFATPRVVLLREEPGWARRLTGLLADIAAEMAEPDAGASPAPAWLVRAALWRLAKLARSGRPGHPGRATFVRFLALVEARFRDGWSIAAYARALGLSAKRLNRLTQAHAGINAHGLRASASVARSLRSADPPRRADLDDRLRSRLRRSRLFHAVLQALDGRKPARVPGGAAKRGLGFRFAPRGALVGRQDLPRQAAAGPVERDQASL